MTERQISKHQDRWDLFEELFLIDPPESSLDLVWSDEHQVLNASALVHQAGKGDFALWRCVDGYVINIKRMDNRAWWVERYPGRGRDGGRMSDDRIAGWCRQFPDVLRLCEYYGALPDDALAEFAIYGAEASGNSIDETP